MGRRSASQRVLTELQHQIQLAFNSSPLEPVGKALEALLIGSDAAIHCGVGRPGQEGDLANFIRPRFDALPKSFGSRFHVDSVIVAEIVEACSAGQITLSRMFAPRYGQEWGHQRVDIPYDREQFHVIDVVLMPGHDDLSSLDLLDYPWLLHEIGHSIHFRSKRFSEEFQPRLEETLKTMRARTVSDRGNARSRSIESIEKFSGFWSPTLDHRNWAHEIAADIVALWLCGPAFLAALSHLLRDRRPLPFQITQHHPPYDVRVSAILDAAERLGWVGECGELEEQRNDWQVDASKSGQTNEYLALRDKDTLTSTVTSALTACDEFCLPRLDHAKLARLRKLVEQPTECDFGIDLIIAAWIAERELDDTAFREWHDDVVSELYSAVTRESP